MVEVRHPDFEKIHAAFLQHYSKNLQLGEERYNGWVKDSNLDETQSYYLQGAQRAAGTRQNFDWAKVLLQFIKEDKDAYYYKVEALFPVESMNKDTPPFKRDEVLQAARSLTGKPSDLNHDHSKMLEGVEVTAAQFEDDCVECVVRVPKTSPLVGMIQRKEIVSVSIEGEWSHGIPGQGLVLTGLGWLTKQTMLPGIPLTRIMPVEQIAESFKPHVAERKLVKVGSCVGCGGKADYLVSACKDCYGKFTADATKQFLAPTTPDSLSCVFCGQPGEYVVTTCGSYGENAQAAAAETSVNQQLEPQMPGEYLLGFTQDSSLFLAEHFSVLWLDQTNGILALMAKTRADPSMERCQSILFLSSKWQPNTVADWLGSHPDYQQSAGLSIQSNIGGVEKLEEKDLELIAEKVAAKINRNETAAVTEKLKTEVSESKRLQGEAESKAKVAEELQVKAASDLTNTNKVIEGFKKSAPGVDLLAVPPVLMPVSEHIAVLERLLPSVMVERSSMGMQRQAQTIRSEVLKAQEKLRVK